VDLCFQEFAGELAYLPGDYGEPGGLLLLVLVNGTLVGWRAFLSLPHSDHLNTCEMKRVYVRPALVAWASGVCW
jgi:putative acetyltransferase